jgi:hypothetical protein
MYHHNLILILILKPVEDRPVLYFMIYPTVLFLINNTILKLYYIDQ